MIEQIPLPKQRMSGLTDMIRRLSIGDSFFWPVNSSKGLHATALRLKVKITIRKEEEGVRIWRVG
jgi:hypothetical protein